VGVFVIEVPFLAAEPFLQGYSTIFKYAAKRSWLKNQMARAIAKSRFKYCTADPMPGTNPEGTASWSADLSLVSDFEPLMRLS
jgi:hypothetical protein